MSDSIFSSLKVVAMMLAVDQDIDAKERAWFMAVMNSFGVRHAQRNTLRELLQGRSKEDLKTVLSAVTDLRDRQRLSSFLKVAMKMDGVVKPSELDFYSQVQSLLNDSQTDIDYLNYGKEILKRDNDLRLWMALGDLGSFLSQKRTGYFLGYQRSSLLLTLIFDIPAILRWRWPSLPSFFVEYVFYEKRKYFIAFLIFLLVFFIVWKN